MDEVNQQKDEIPTWLLSGGEISQEKSQQQRGGEKQYDSVESRPLSQFSKISKIVWKVKNSLISIRPQRRVVVLGRELLDLLLDYRAVAILLASRDFQVENGQLWVGEVLCAQHVWHPIRLRNRVHEEVAQIAALLLLGESSLIHRNWACVIRYQ